MPLVGMVDRCGQQKCTCDTRGPSQKDLKHIEASFSPILTDSLCKVDFCDFDQNLQKSVIKTITTLDQRGVRLPLPSRILNMKS